MSAIRFFIKKILYEIFTPSNKSIKKQAVFLSDFINNILDANKIYYAFDEIFELKEALLYSNQQIEVKDLGAGSKRMPDSQRKVKDIASYSTINPKYGEILFRLINYFSCKTIIELGTSLGIGTAYLAKVSKNNQIYSIEGCPQLVKLAQNNLTSINIKHVNLLQGSFDEVLPEVLNKIEQIDFVFFDGNHRYEPTLRYFNMCIEKIHNESIFVFDDIHWSPEMEKAWNEIKRNKKVRQSFDLFQLGIVFFKKELSKQNFTLKY